MTRRDGERLADILLAIEAINSHLQRGSLGDGLVYDGVRLRLIEIGEAVKGISADVLAKEPNVPWADVAGMPDWLARHSFDTTHALVQATVADDLPALEAAIRRLHGGQEDQGRSPADGDAQRT